LGRALFGLCWRALEEGRVLLQRSSTGAPQGGTPAWLGRTLEHIAHEPGTPVSALAGVAGLSPAQFRRAFHAWVGVSPQTHVTRARLDEARRLLLTTDWVVATVAERVGYVSLSYFTRLFKQQFGLSPARYRDVVRQPGA
jgi:AraC family transcriptional regulator